MKLAAWRRLARAQSRLVRDAVVAGVDEAGRGPLAGPVGTDDDRTSVGGDRHGATSGV